MIYLVRQYSCYTSRKNQLYHVNKATPLLNTAKFSWLIGDRINGVPLSYVLFFPLFHFLMLFLFFFQGALYVLLNNRMLFLIVHYWEVMVDVWPVIVQVRTVFQAM